MTVDLVKTGFLRRSRSSPGAGAGARQWLFGPGSGRRRRRRERSRGVRGVTLRFARLRPRRCDGSGRGDAIAWSHCSPPPPAARPPGRGARGQAPGRRPAGAAPQFLRSLPKWRLLFILGSWAGSRLLLDAMLNVRDWMGGRGPRGPIPRRTHRAMRSPSRACACARAHAPVPNVARSRARTHLPPWGCAGAGAGAGAAAEARTAQARPHARLRAPAGACAGGAAALRRRAERMRRRRTGAEDVRGNGLTVGNLS